MNMHIIKNIWKSGLLLALLCLLSMPHSVGAAALAPVPTGPLDAYLGIPDYYTTANWANSPPLAKFVDSLPGLDPGNSNNLGQYLPVAVPDTTSYPGSDYYIIALRQYTKQLHSDLNPTTLRGYVQLNEDGSDKTVINYLGPVIVAQRDRPVRLKFINQLPLTDPTNTNPQDGKLFIPVDTSVMGAGEGPLGPAAGNYPQNRADIHLHGGRTPWISDGTPHQWITPAGEPGPYLKGVSLQNVPDMPDPGPGASTYYFTNQQSARLMFYHDHAFGITRLNVYAGEAAGYLITDQFEAALVSGGKIPPAADTIPLVIQDKTFVDATPTVKYKYNPVSGLFDDPITVPAVRVSDPLWNWGSSSEIIAGVRTPVTGDLWLPHVYMPAQSSIAGAGGVNPFGRWMYGPWFYPATVVEKGPVANPYYDPNCSSINPFVLAECQTPGQPELIPGTPNVSMGMEAFQDSVVVNGTAFPTLTVDPKTYRFRILNAAGDRFQNLSFYVADTTPGNVSTDPRLNGANPGNNPGGLDTRNFARSNRTEVKMAPASAQLAAVNNWPALWPIDGRDGGVPDPGLCQPGGVACPNFGPSFLQIASEGGFLPKPVVIDPQPITYITDPTAFWVGNVDKMGLALGPAERADVIVDFSKYAGQTLILYNDAPAAWPARVAGYDYYTGAPDLRDSGGYGTGGSWDPITGTWLNGSGPLPGKAPNTRTVLQVIVKSAPIAAPFDQAALETEFTTPAPAGPYAGTTLFERAQEPIIVGQASYASAYPNSYFPTNFPWEGINQINDHFLQFVTVKGEQVVAVTEPKGLHDEMGASFDPIYGRMSGNLAMQIPNPTTLTANLILYGFSDLPTETIKNSLSSDVQVNVATKTLTDGTQIWKISHNGVDTHPIHFHIFDVQLINRVGWDGQILMPEPNELGWKDTVKISPLEDTIVAVRPRAPAMPFGIPNSIRPLNPALPLDSAMGFSNIDPTTGQAYVYKPGPPAYPYTNYNVAGVVTNILYDFGWEYVWHCHILSHEEMDMMRPIVLKYEAALPPAFAAQAAPNATTGAVDLTWNDPTPVNYTGYPVGYGDPGSEIGFNVLRSTDGTTYSPLAALLANSTSYSDSAPLAGALYKIEAFNAAGSTFSSVASTIPVSVAAATAPFNAPATITLTATVGALPAGTTVASVAFYNGATLIGTSTDSASPYGFVWANVAAGSYSVTARVTDNFGGISVSAALTVDVTGTLTVDFSTSGSAAGADIGYCETVTFTAATNAVSPTFSWLINGSNPTTGIVSTTLPTGIYPVTLGVLDTSSGQTVQVTKSVTIVNHSPVAIPGGPYSISSGNLTLAGLGSDADACNAGLSYAWNIDNIGPYDFFTANPTISYSTLNKVLGSGIHTITLQVTDSNGAVGTATTTLTVLAGAPASITVPATNTTGVYQVSWTPSATAGASYTLQESTDPLFGTFTETVNAVSPATITPKADGTYYYRVKAVKAGVPDSAWTTGANGCAVTLPVPGGPVITSVIPGNRIVTVSFTAPPAGGSPILYYTVTSTPGGITATGTASPIVVSGLTNNIAYTFTMTATNSFGTGPISSPSATVVPTSSRPLNPTGLLATASVPSLAVPTVTLTWTDTSNNEVGFTLQRATNSSFTTGLTTFTLPANSVSYTDNGVLGNIRYYYRVRAFNYIGVSAYSSTVTVLPAQLPADPTNLTFVSSASRAITISWTDNSDIERGFYIERSSTGATGPWSRVATLGASTAASPATVTYTNSGLSRTPGTTYWYRVQAYVSGGVSGYTNVISGTTP